jgi:hypothetical protein
MNEVSAFGVIHKSLVSKKVYPPKTLHRYLWRSTKVAPQYGGTKVVKPGKTPPNPASKNSQKKAARRAALGNNDVRAGGAVETMPYIKSTRQGAMTGQVIGKNPADKARALKQGDRIGGDAFGRMRFAGSDMRAIRAHNRAQGR